MSSPQEKKKRGRPPKKDKEQKPKKKVEAAKKQKKQKKDEESWWEEPIRAGLKSKTKLNGMLAEVKSEFQEIGVIDIANFGKVLILDGFTQSAERDEFIYHECLVHPALTFHPNPKRVFIGGGGEMATAREVLKHKSVERLVMCDIDKEVVDLSRKHLPEWGGNQVFEDPRFECHYQDAKKFIQDSKEKFDVIIMDIADPIEAGPGIALYFQEFYKNVQTKCNPGFVFVTQSGPCGLITKEECFTTINRTIASAFDVVVPMSAHIPSFHDCWGWNLAYNRHDSLTEDLVNRTPETVDRLLKERLKDGATTGFYDGIGHRGIYSIPKYIREAIAKETRIMTEKNPVFMDAGYQTAGEMISAKKEDDD